jgi:hypothetical protein
MGKIGALDMGIALLVLIIIGGGITVFVLFQLTLQRTLDAVSPKNRQMSGGSVWLNLIPVFNLVFPFIFNNALKNSIEMEYFDRKIAKPVNLATGTVVYPLMTLLSVFFSFLYYVSYDKSLSILSGLAGLTNFITQIVFWTQVASHKKVLLGTSTETYQHQNGYQAHHTVPQVKYCSNCKNPVALNDNFCLICGFDTRTNYQAHQVTTPTQPIQEVVSVTAPKIEPTIASTSAIEGESKVDKLNKYYEMLQQDLITKEDFERIKKELL